jgi:hypothetical protein
MSGRGSRIAITIVLTMAVAAAAAVDAITPSQPTRVTPVASSADAGVLACASLTSGTSRGFLHLANLSEGRRPARVTITYVSSARARSQSLQLPAGAVRTIAVKGVKGRTAAIIEYAGGAIVASHSIWTPRSGVAGAACSHPMSGDIVVPHLRTLRSRSVVSVFNPGGAEPNVTVTLWLPGGRRISRVRLTNRVIHARSRRDFSIGDFAFDAPEVAAVVHATGPIVVEGQLMTPNGFAATEGVAASAQTIPIAALSGRGAIGVVNPGAQPIELSSRIMTRASQGAAPGFAPALDERTAIVRAIPSRDHGASAAYLLSASAGTVAATTSWIRGARSHDIAYATGTAPARRIGAVGAVIGKGGAASLLISNPGDEPASVHVRVLGRMPSVRDLVIEAGRLVAIGLPVGSVAASLDASQPIGAMLEVRYVSAAGVGTMGIATTPMDVPAPVGVLIDPRAGVPAAREPQ